jgi:hypothetical protein
MRSILISLTLALTASAVQSQIFVERNNRPYLVISTAKHTTTSLNYTWPPTVPAGFAVGGGGVPAGTYTYRCYLGQHDTRWSPYRWTGYTYIGRNSAATAGGGVGIQSFNYLLLNEAAGNPNWAQLPVRGGTPIVNVPAAAIAPGGQVYRVTSNQPALTFPYPQFPAAIYIVRCWPNNLANDDTPDRWAHASSWQDGPVMPSPHDGSFHEPSNVQTPSTDPLFIQWVANQTDMPVAMPHSNYGQRRIAPLTPELRGHSAGTGFPDLASNAAGIELGFDWNCGVPTAGGFAIPLFNYGEVAPFPACFTFLGAEISLNPANPFFSFFTFLIASLDPQGNALGPKLFIPQQPGTAGQWMGLQGVVIDTSFNLSNTAAYWFRIQ